MEYKRINFTHKDLMAFQNDILLTDEEKFIILCVQLIEYNQSPAINFNMLYSIGKDGFKFDDKKIQRLEKEVLLEKSRIRSCIFESTITLNIYDHYKSNYSTLSEREKYIISSFCLAEVRNALGVNSISHLEDQFQGLFRVSKEDHKQIHKDINKLNFISQNMLAIFKQ